MDGDPGMGERSCISASAYTAKIVRTRRTLAPSMKVGANVSGFFTTRRLLLLLAALLSVAAAVYSFRWAYYIRSLPQGRIGRGLLL